MRIPSVLVRQTVCVAALAAALGLGTPAVVRAQGKAPAKVTPAAGTGHAHPDHGPHGGPLIELGNEKYHAELLHDEKAQTITVYVLDGKAKNEVPLPAKFVRINIKRAGKGEQYQLKPAPQKHETAGKTARFVLKDNTLCDRLHAEGIDARLVIEIEGKSYSGRVAHSHDHDHVHP
jgi:hypothetical protein